VLTAQPDGTTEFTDSEEFFGPAVDQLKPVLDQLRAEYTRNGAALPSTRGAAHQAMGRSTMDPGLNDGLDKAASVCARKSPIDYANLQGQPHRESQLPGKAQQLARIVQGWLGDSRYRCTKVPVL
jgi:hypothetical protein